MGIVGNKLDIDFVISTGDNFYDDGLTGVDDPAFEDSFTKIYTAPSLQKQWYSGMFSNTFLFCYYYYFFHVVCVNCYTIYIDRCYKNRVKITFWPILINVKIFITYVP